jgi:putative hydrolase of the HAD superfamily
MKYKHLFFDLDHTLWDFEKNSERALQTCFNQFKLDSYFSFNEFIEKYKVNNELLWRRYKDGYIGSEELKWKRMWRTLLDFKIANETLAKNLADFYLKELPKQGLLFDYSKEILNYLKGKQYTLHIISNGFQDVQHQKLRNSDIHHFFDNIICSEAVNATKPNKLIFDIALNKANAQLTESIMLGDNPEADIQGAINANMDVVYVNHTNQPIELPVQYEITHLKQLENIL